MLRFLITILALYTMYHPLRADDTLTVADIKPYQQKIDRFTSSRLYRMTYIGVPLVVGGLIVKEEDDHFRSLRNDYMPAFRRNYDDYMQYLPAAVMLGLKIGGVEGRSSWGRMLVSDAFSVAIMGAVVNTLKSTTNVTRPDGSNNHSFPSGHTATAFMAATMLHKEYGGRSPWYSIGGYTVATATGLMRQFNNKHWMSDVMVGAGIGILSTELGYYLADLIFKEKGIRHYPVTESFDKEYRPSFLGIYLGLNLMPGHYDMGNGSKLKFSTGSNVGVEGAWFMTPYVGLGGRVTVSNVSVVKNDTEAEDQSLDYGAAFAGAYLSYPLASRWLIGGKLLGGYTHFKRCSLPDLEIGDRGGLSGSAGLTTTFLAKQNLGVRFFMDYTVMPSVMSISKKCLQTWTLGSNVTISF